MPKKTTAKPSKPVLILSRPKNRTLKAFKEWISQMVVALGGDAVSDDMSAEEWRRDWKSFWMTADKKQARQSHAMKK